LYSHEKKKKDGTLFFNQIKRLYYERNQNAVTISGRNTVFFFSPPRSGGRFSLLSRFAVYLFQSRVFFKNGTFFLVL
jgi:hypothetical protein